MWALALVLDIAGPYFFGAEGWQLKPHHFAERHGLIVIETRSYGEGRRRRRNELRREAVP